VTNRPTCPRCRAPVERLQRSVGVVAVYPCGCWLSPKAARALVDEHRARSECVGRTEQVDGYRPAAGGPA